ncbi:NAD(P)H dehydrogenase (quinone) [Rhodobacter sp. 140A]|nr:NAD(P)H dehydrogenase (quinone) [Rhodobacter sp. 140A]
MTGTLVIVAHPDLAHSRINAAWAAAARGCEGCTVHDLYAEPPGGRIDSARERARIDAHDRIVLQFPLTWYSCPPRLSEWMGAVLQRGWAYGPGGRALRLKTLGIAVSTGSNGEDYSPDGRYGHTLDAVTLPFELLAIHTGMHYLPAFTLTGVRDCDDAALAQSAARYARHLCHAAPRRIASGADDARAKTRYPTA